MLVAMMSFAAFAQVTVTGTITDGTDPLPGASVLVKGTTVGAFTDEAGRFTVKVPGSEGTLVITYIGFIKEEIAVSASNASLNVTMRPTEGSMEEVVIVGYGTQTKASVSGSLASISGDQVEQVPLGSVEQALQGNVAGVQSVMSNGQPGANVSVLIRGQGSISASSQPLYVIDGIPVISGNLTSNAESSNPMATLNPNDIESVNVLKDAAATAIYGSRGSNGVILITTKSGRPGKTKIDFRTQIGSNDWAVPEKKSPSWPDFSGIYRAVY